MNLKGQSVLSLGPEKTSIRWKDYIQSLYTTLYYQEKKKRKKEARPLNDHDSERRRNMKAFLSFSLHHKKPENILTN